MSESLKQRLSTLLFRLKKKDSYGFFLEPIDLEDVPDYLDVVKQPMDFSTMHKRLESGYYLSFESFASDFHLICDNCMSYNKPDTVFHKQAHKLKEAGLKLIETAQNKWDADVSAQRSKPTYHTASSAAAKVAADTIIKTHKTVETAKAVKDVSNVAEVAGKKRQRSAISQSTPASVPEGRAPASMPLHSFLARQTSLQVLTTPSNDSLGFAKRVSSVTGKEVSTGCGHTVLNAVVNALPFSAPTSVFDASNAHHKLIIDTNKDYRPLEDGWCCAICDEPDAYEGNALLRCSNAACLVVVHQLCYGIQEIPATEWFCDPCSLGLHTSFLPCSLCKSSGGAMKPSDRGTLTAQTLSSIIKAASQQADESATHRACPGGTPPPPVCSLAETETCQKPRVPRLEIFESEAPVERKQTVKVVKKPRKEQRLPMRISQRRKEKDGMKDEPTEARATENSTEVIDKDATHEADDQQVSAAEPVEDPSAVIPAGAGEEVEVHADEDSESVQMGSKMSLEDVYASERHPLLDPESTLVPAEWVHVVCAIYVPEVGFGNVRSMTPVINLPRVHARRGTIACRLCKEVGGAVIQCTRGSCGYSAHAQCARFAHLQLLFEYDAKSKQYRHAMHCPKHDDRPLSALSRIDYADRCALQRAEIRRMQQADARRQALQQDKLTAMHARHANRLLRQKSRRQQGADSLNRDDAVEDALASMMEGVAEDMLDYDSASDSDDSSILSDVGADGPKPGGGENGTSAFAGGDSSDDEPSNVPTAPRRGRKPKARPPLVEPTDTSTMSLSVGSSSVLWSACQPFFKIPMFSRAMNRLERFFTFRRRSIINCDCPVPLKLPLALEAVAEHYLRLREREAANSVTVLPPDVQYTAMTKERSATEEERNVAKWSILSSLAHNPPYRPHHFVFENRSKIQESAGGLVAASCSVDLAVQRRILHALSVNPTMYPSFMTSPKDEMDNRVLDALRYRPLYNNDSYLVTYREPTGRDADFLSKCGDTSRHADLQQEDVWKNSVNIMDKSSAPKYLSSANSLDSAFDIPELGCSVIDVWSAQCNGNANSSPSNGPTLDSSITFGGWGEGEDFTELRQVFAPSLTTSMATICNLAKSGKLLTDTRFRFATAEDARILHTLNRVNEAFTCSDDFKATISAKNEFVLIAVRPVNVNGIVEEHIVGFVNYYFSWFTDKTNPSGERPRPARVVYVATLQAVRTATHPDITGTGAQTDLLMTPKRAPAADTPGSFSRLPSTRGRHRDRSDSSPSAKSKSKAFPDDSFAADEGEQSSPREPKSFYPFSSQNPGAEPRTGTILFALALAHAKDLGMSAVLVDSTDGAAPYYLRVVGMSPLVKRVGTKYHPMFLDLRFSDPISLACPMSMSAATPADAVANDSVVQKDAVFFDEILAELDDCQSILRDLKQENDFKANKLLGIVSISDLSRSQQSQVMRRRNDRRIWTVYSTVHEREAAALEEERQKAEEDMDACCAICGGADSFPKNLILFCDKCNVPVHQQCYGITVIPEGDWFCQPCQAGIRPVDVQCALCAVRGGPLAPLHTAAVPRSADGVERPKTWVHVVCASLCHPKLKIERSNAANQVFAVPGAEVNDDALHWLHTSTGAQVCSVCGTTEGKVHGCHVPGCRGGVHGICAVECGLISVNGSCDIQQGEFAFNVVQKANPDVAGALGPAGIRWIADNTLPIHPHKVARYMGPQRSEDVEPLYFYCPSHRVPVPCRLQQGAQALSDALQKLISRMHDEELKLDLTSLMDHSQPSDDMQHTIGRQLSGMPVDVSKQVLAIPRVSLEERLQYIALHMASLTEEFCPSVAGDLDLLTAIGCGRRTLQAEVPPSSPQHSTAVKSEEVGNEVEHVTTQSAGAPMLLEDNPVSLDDLVVPDKVDDDEIVCAVCGEADSEPGNAIVFCDSCELRVHQSCYGISEVPSGSWSCEPCRHKVPSKFVPCVLCSGCGGALKATARGISMASTNGVPVEWAHVICTIWVAEVRFADPVTMTPVEGLSDIPLLRWKLRCRICKQKHGAPIQCAVDSCTFAYHVTCGMHGGYYFGYDETSTPRASTQSSRGRRRGRPPKASPRVITDEGAVETDTEVAKVTYCPKHKPSVHGAAESSSMPACFWFPHRAYLDKLPPACFETAVKAMSAALAADGSASSGSLRSYITAMPAASLENALQAIVTSYTPKHLLAQSIKPTRGRKPASHMAVVSRVQPQSSVPASYKGHRYPPILLSISDPKHPLFQPLLRTLVTMYNYKLNVKLLGSASDISTKFSASQTEKDRQGIRMLDLEDCTPKRKRKRGMQEMGTPLSVVLDSQSLIEELDDREQARRHCIFGPTCVVQTGLPALFGRDAVTRVATHALSDGIQPKRAAQVAKPPPVAVQLPPDSFILPGIPAVFAGLSSAVERQSVRCYRRVALMRSNAAGGKSSMQITSGDTAPTNEECPTPAAVFADSLSFKGAVTVEILKTDEHGNIVKENVALDDSRYCVCRKTYAEDSSVMVGCSRCEEWFHIACLGLTVCVPHTPGYDPKSGQDPSQLTCLVDPEGSHIDVKNDYLCPKCSGTRWGVPA